MPGGKAGSWRITREVRFDEMVVRAVDADRLELPLLTESARSPT